MFSEQSHAAMGPIAATPLRLRREIATPVGLDAVMRASRFAEDIQTARRHGRLPERFRADTLRRACPGWADRTYSVFLPKHRRGNPGGYTEYFEQHADGSYSLLNEG